MWLPRAMGVRSGSGVPGVLHDDEIPIDAGLVRASVDRAMPQYADLPVRPVPSTGSTNALFRLGEDLLVRLPRRPGGSAAIGKEAKWLPVRAPSLPVAVPELVAVFAPDCDYPEHWSVIRWIDGVHPVGGTTQATGSATRRRARLRPRPPRDPDRAPVGRGVVQAAAWSATAEATKNARVRALADLQVTWSGRGAAGPEAADECGAVL